MKYNIGILIIWFLLAGCEKENEVKPSYLETDWFTIVDNPDDPLQHKVYEVFTDWGIPVFYNDTIGRQDRGLDQSGHPVIFYKILDLNYNLNNPENAFSIRAKHISLIREKSDIWAGIELLEEKLFPLLPEKFYIHSILLLDSLYEEEWDNKYPLRVYRGMETLAVAGVPEIAGMTEEEKNAWVNEIAVYLAVNYLAANALDGIDTFRKESYDPVLQRSIYGLLVCPPRYPGFICVQPDRWEVYGFLDYDHSQYADIAGPDPANWRYSLVKEEEDLEAFIMAVLSSDEEEFANRYADYPKILRKYRLMADILTTVGFKLQ